MLRLAIDRDYLVMRFNTPAYGTLGNENVKWRRKLLNVVREIPG